MGGGGEREREREREKERERKRVTERVLKMIRTFKSKGEREKTVRYEDISGTFGRSIIAPS